MTGLKEFSIVEKFGVMVSAQGRITDVLNGVDSETAIRTMENLVRLFFSRMEFFNPAQRPDLVAVFAESTGEVVANYKQENGVFWFKQLSCMALN